MSTSGLQAAHLFIADDKKPDPKSLNYCGYTCPEGCEFKKASLEDDAALKKEAFEAWKIEERYGITFEAEKVFCFGCKIADKPAGVVTANCTVRICAMDKGMEACIQCKELTTCKKDLWTRFPDLYKQVIELQKQYSDT